MPHHDDREDLDEAPIRQLVEAFVAAWNEHDPAGMATPFAEDADCVTLGGDWLRGRAAFEADLAGDHVTVFRASTLATTDVQVRFLRPDVAVAHVTFALQGLTGRDGTVLPLTANSIATHTCVRDGAAWRIVVFQNTRIEPPPAEFLVKG